jgi:hypothetical protein
MSLMCQVVWSSLHYNINKYPLSIVHTHSYIIYTFFLLKFLFFLSPLFIAIDDHFDNNCRSVISGNFKISSNTLHDVSWIDMVLKMQHFAKIFFAILFFFSSWIISFRLSNWFPLVCVAGIHAGSFFPQVFLFYYTILLCCIYRKMN